MGFIMSESKPFCGKWDLLVWFTQEERILSKEELAKTLSIIDLLPGSKKHPIPRKPKKIESNVIDLRTKKPVQPKRVHGTNFPGVPEAHIRSFKKWKDGSKG